MKRKLLLFLLSICFFLPDFAATGQYNFIRVDGGSGLSNSHVKSIIQDSYGFIWLGTDRKSTRLNSSHRHTSRMPSSA